MMHMMWMRMPGQSWPGAAAAFVGMWTMMMVPMMLPVLLPSLWRYRRAGPLRIALVAAGYFVIWGALGIVVFPVVVALGRIPPVAGCVVVLAAAAFQWTRWKAHHLMCCRESPRRPLPPGVMAAWRRGVELGLHCCSCSAGLTAILLVAGMMDVRAMVVVAAATAVERLVPAGEQLSRVIGAGAAVWALTLISRA